MQLTGSEVLRKNLGVRVTTKEEPRVVLPFGEYCAFTKSLEHLGDRWSLLIVRNLAVLGPLGFNGIADSLPGISRSVLARRLRTLDELGIIARAGAFGSIQHAPYRLTPAGEQLMPTLLSLRSWAERWVPEDASIAEHDPDVIVWWLIDRVDPAAVPDRPVVLALEVAGIRRKNVWLLLEPGAVPSVCVADSDLPLDRYVYVQADAVTLLPIARGARTWSDAVSAGDVRIFGEPSLVPSLSSWFRGAEKRTRHGEASLPA